MQDIDLLNKIYSANELFEYKKARRSGLNIFIKNSDDNEVEILMPEQNHFNVNSPSGEGYLTYWSSSLISYNEFTEYEIFEPLNVINEQLKLLKMIYDSSITTNPTRKPIGTVTIPIEGVPTAFDVYTSTDYANQIVDFFNALKNQGIIIADNLNIDIDFPELSS